MHLCDVGCFVHTFPFSALCNDMFAMHVCATHWLSMHSYTLAYMSMHESCLLVCHPYLNTMKLWTFDPSLHLSPVDTTFSLLFHLFAFSLVCLYTCFSDRHAYHMLFASLLFIACLLDSCLCLCMYTHGARTLRARAQSSRHRQKGHGCKHVVKPSGSVQ